MAYLLDTSILLRLANTTDPFHATASQAAARVDVRSNIVRQHPSRNAAFRSIADDVNPVRAGEPALSTA